MLTRRFKRNSTSIKRRPSDSSKLILPSMRRRERLNYKRFSPRHIKNLTRLRKQRKEDSPLIILMLRHLPKVTRSPYEQSQAGTLNLEQAC